MHEMTYEPQGVCSTRIRLAVADGMVVRASVEEGCDGNSQGLCRLAEGRPVAEVIRRLKGIRCGSKATSCPDQLARALEKMAAGAASPQPPHSQNQNQDLTRRDEITKKSSRSDV